MSYKVKLGRKYFGHSTLWTGTACFGLRRNAQTDFASFSAVALGLPKALRDDDIECEYPVDADDENVTRKGFRPGNPGESTKLSSALAVFRGARVLSKVLDQCYSTTASQGLSLQTVAVLNDELNQWKNDLAPHLKLEFVQDKPCTNVISSRCPLIVSR